MIVRDTWKVCHDRPLWERAWSADGGTTWEDNWVMDFTRVDWPLEIGEIDGQWRPMAVSR